MPEWPRFPNAPITEALLDIQVRLPQGADLEVLSRTQDRFRNLYSIKQERRHHRLEFKLGPQERALHSSEQPDGFLFKSADGTQIVQARLDGFTFNRLRPYDRWAAFREEAGRRWLDYVEVAKPEAITRLSLRYINRVEIPIPSDDLRGYILMLPDLPPAMRSSVASFYMRLVLPRADKAATAIVTLAFDPVGPESTRLPVVFDIDVFTEVVLSPQSEETWTAFETLRDLKNEIFFSGLTAKAKELFS